MRRYFHGDAASIRSQPPRVWALLGAHVGDNAQVLQLARDLGIPFEAKQMRFTALYRVPFWLRGAGLGSLTPESRRLLAPPWPDLVIGIGRRLAPIALHVQRASGGHTRTVMLGRPRAPLHLFDLVVTTPQYRLPPAPNLVELLLPFAARVNTPPDELDHWRTQWSELPRPLVVVLVGAQVFPQRFGIAQADELAARARAAAGAGSVLLIGSPRTKDGVLARVASRVGGSFRAYPYEPHANPYPAALQLADRIVVTSDSMSMLADALLCGRPVSVFELPAALLARKFALPGAVGAGLARLGVMSPPRDVGAAASQLIEAGYADRLGSGTNARRMPAPDYRGVLNRVSALLRYRDTPLRGTATRSRQPFSPSC